MHRKLKEDGLSTVKQKSLTIAKLTAFKILIQFLHCFFFISTDFFQLSLSLLMEKPIFSLKRA